MEIVDRRNPAPAVPFVLVIAVVAALLMAVAAAALARPAGPAAHPTSTGVTATAISPDAQDRNAKLLADRLGKAEATHGH